MSELQTKVFFLSIKKQCKKCQKQGIKRSKNILLAIFFQIKYSNRLLYLFSYLKYLLNTWMLKENIAFHDEFEGKNYLVLYNCKCFLLYLSSIKYDFYFIKEKELLSPLFVYPHILIALPPPPYLLMVCLFIQNITQLATCITILRASLVKELMYDVRGGGGHWEMCDHDPPFSSIFRLNWQLTLPAV